MSSSAQKLFSRSHKTVSSSTAVEGIANAGSPGKRISSPSSSPTRKPFKRKKRRWLWWSNSSLATKCILIGFCCGCLIILADVHHHGLSPETPKTNNNLQRGKLNLRPAYLTDDGAKDADDDGGDGGDEGDDDGDDADDQEIEDEGEEEEGLDDAEGEWNENADEEGEIEEELEGAEIDVDDGTQEKVRLHSSSRRDRKWQHQIPRILIFTHYKNLLELVPSKLLHGERVHTDNAAPNTNTNPYQHLTPEEVEEYTLAANVRHSIDIHNQSAYGEDDEELQVLFWTDEDCIQSLERTRPKLVPHFKTETEGMYKADICRGTALLEHGGFYLDVDVGVRHDLWLDVRPQTQFVTARVHQASNWVGKGFFQAILGASPGSPVMERYLELFEKHYNGTSRVQKGPLGVLLLSLAWEEVRKERNEESPQTPNITAEFYQEFLFHENGPFNSGPNKGVLSPAPTWGKRRACHFIVAAIANDPSNVELVLESNNPEGGKEKKSIGLQIPVLSRIPGSRMCVADSKEDKTYNSTRMIEAMKWWERT